MWKTWYKNWLKNTMQIFLRAALWKVVCNRVIVVWSWFLFPKIRIGLRRHSFFWEAREESGCNYMGSLSHGCSFSLPTIKLCWLLVAFSDVNPWDSYFPGWISCHKVKLSLQSSAQLSHLLRVLRKETQQCFVYTKPFLQLFFDMCLYPFCFGGKT